MKYNDVLTIIKDFEESSLSSLELEIEDIKIKMTKGAVMPPPFAQTNPEPIVVNQPGPVVAQEGSLKKKGLEVRSPLVGTFYAAASPDAEPFVHVGDTVKKGDTICIIEAMKIMNEITAPASGKVLAIHAKNTDAIGFDQLLVTLSDAK